MENVPPVIREFLNFLTVARGCSDKTVSEYRRDLHTFFCFLLSAKDGAKNGSGPEPGAESDPGAAGWPDGIDAALLRTVTPGDLARYIAWLRTEKKVETGRADTTAPGLAPATTRRRAACLRSFFRYLTENAALLDRDPSAGLVVPKKNAVLPFFFTEEECGRLLEAVDGLNRERDYALVLLALVSGLRVSELVSLNVHDIRYTDGLSFFRVTGKGGKERQVYLSENCVEALDRYLTVRETYVRPARSSGSHGDSPGGSPGSFPRNSPGGSPRDSSGSSPRDSFGSFPRDSPGGSPRGSPRDSSGSSPRDSFGSFPRDSPSGSPRDSSGSSPADSRQAETPGLRPEDADALFLSRKRRRLSVDAVQSLVKRAARRAGLTPVSPHKLRHTAASLMLGHGVDIRTISEVLGHSSISSTQIYTHLQSAQLIEACRANPVSRIGTEPRTEARTESDALTKPEAGTKPETDSAETGKKR